jgi:hypothetical protein
MYNLIEKEFNMRQSCLFGFVCLSFSISMAMPVKAIYILELMDPVLKTAKVESVVRPCVKDMFYHRNLEGKVTLKNDTISESFWQDLTEKLFDTYWEPKTHNLVHAAEDFSHFIRSDISCKEVFFANVFYYSYNKLSPKRKDDRLKVLEQAAALGHDEAQYQMYKEYFKKGRYQEARNYLMSSASQGNAEAFYALSSLYDGASLMCHEIDLDRAKSLCQEAAFLGHESAIFDLQVAAFTEGMFGEAIDFQKGILNAQSLTSRRAMDFVDSIKSSSVDELCETFDFLTEDDLTFLTNKIGWSPEEAYLSDD